MVWHALSHVMELKAFLTSKVASKHKGKRSSFLFWTADYLLTNINGGAVGWESVLSSGDSSGCPDLWKRGRSRFSRSFQPCPAYTVACIMLLCLVRTYCSLLIWALRLPSECVYGVFGITKHGKCLTHKKIYSFQYTLDKLKQKLFVYSARLRRYKTRMKTNYFKTTRKNSIEK